MASPDRMDPVHRRRDSHRLGILQDQTRLDDGSSAGRKVCEVPGMESCLWVVLGGIEMH